MSDPMQRAPDSPGPLFSPPTWDCTQTSRRAGAVAAKYSSTRYRQIVQLLAERPMTLWELAGRIGCFDHQISGRITDLLKAGRIERTGETRPNPATNCAAAVYRLRTPPTP